MAQDRRQEQRQSVADLRQEIAHSRDRLGRDLSGLRYELDFPLKFRKSFQRHTASWVSAAVLAGAVSTAKGISRQKPIRISTKDGQAKKGEEQKKGLLQAGLAMGVLR